MRHRFQRTAAIDYVFLRASSRNAANHADVRIPARLGEAGAAL
jgi:hypothetical protein